MNKQAQQEEVNKEVEGEGTKRQKKWREQRQKERKKSEESHACKATLCCPVSTGVKEQTATEPDQFMSTLGLESGPVTTAEIWSADPSSSWTSNVFCTVNNMVLHQPLQGDSDHS